MRVLSIILWVLAALACAAWAYIYAYIGAMACAFSGPSGSQNCGVVPPWQLHGEDLTYLVIIPFLVVLGIALAAFTLGRAAARKQQGNG